MIEKKIEVLDVTAARSEAELFLVDTAAVQVWSREFFSDVAEKISFR